MSLDTTLKGPLDLRDGSPRKVLGAETKTGSKKRNHGDHKLTLPKTWVKGNASGIHIPPEEGVLGHDNQEHVSFPHEGLDERVDTKTQDAEGRTAKEGHLGFKEESGRRGRGRRGGAVF